MPRLHNSQVAAPARSVAAPRPLAVISRMKNVPSAGAAAGVIRMFLWLSWLTVRRAGLVAALRRARVSITKSHAATPDAAHTTFANQLDTHVLERLHNLRQRVHVAANKAVARFHALNGR